MLLERIREAEMGNLPEGLPMPMEVEVIEQLPALLGTELDDPVLIDADAKEACKLMDRVILAITKHGIWLHPNRRFAVTLAS